MEIGTFEKVKTRYRKHVASESGDNDLPAPEQMFQDRQAKVPYAYKGIARSRRWQ